MHAPSLKRFFGPWPQLAGLALVLGLTVAAYSPGLTGPFVFDDYPNIVRNGLVAVDSLSFESLRDAALSSRSGVLRRPLPMASFALNHWLGGFDAFAFKVTNLLIHLVNGLLVYGLARMLLARATPAAAYAPLIAASLWLVHPIQLTSVLYVVQRMTSLMALFVFLGLLVFVLGRQRLEQGRAGGPALMWAGILSGTGLGLACKENAILLPAFAWLIELAFFAGAPGTRAAVRQVRVLFAVTLWLPAAAGLALLALQPDFFLAGYAVRDYTWVERLLTEGRALLFYLSLIFVLDLRHFGIFHDDFALSTGLLEPITTLWSVLAVGALALVAVLGVRAAVSRRAAGRLPGPLAALGFGAAWYLTGHVVESTILPLEPVFEHRNYLPTFGLFLALGWVLGEMGRRWDVRRTVAASLVVVLAVAPAAVTAARAWMWRDDATLTAYLARNHPDSPRSVHAAARRNIVDGRRIEVTYSGLQRAAAASPHAVDSLIELAKILAGYAAHEVGSRLPPGEPVTGPPWDSAFDHPFPRTAAELARAQALVEAAIEERLERAIPTSETLVALIKLQGCVGQGWDVCVPLLGKAQAWHEAVLRNPGLGNSPRARVELSAGKLHLLAGEVEQALAATRRAIALDPDDLGFVLSLVQLLGMLENWEEAERTLGDLETRVGRTGFRAREVAGVRRWLDERHHAAAQRAREAERLGDAGSE